MCADDLVWANSDDPAKRTNFAEEVAAAHGIPIYPTIRDALCAGAPHELQRTLLLHPQPAPHRTAAQRTVASKLPHGADRYLLPPRTVHEPCPLNEWSSSLLQCVHLHCTRHVQPGSAHYSLPGGGCSRDPMHRHSQALAVLLSTQCSPSARAVALARRRTLAFC